MLRVFLGELAGSRSPVHTFTPLLGAQIDLDPGARVDLDVDPSFEHGVLLDQGSLVAAGSALDVADLAYQPTGCDTLALHNPGDEPARAILLGGPPFGEELVMWWNFVGRSHDDIATYRRQWEERDARFGSVDGYRGSVTRLPAPPLPNATLRPRPNPKGTRMSQTDKTGAPTTVTAEPDQYTIAVEGKKVGKAEFIDRGEKRVFTHTEVDKDYEGRGLATILIAQALKETRDAGLRIVPQCPMVAAYVAKHDEYQDSAD